MRRRFQRYPQRNDKSLAMDLEKIKDKLREIAERVETKREEDES